MLATLGQEIKYPAHAFEHHTAVVVLILCLMLMLMLVLVLLSQPALALKLHDAIVIPTATSGNLK
jgi:hypothetical protein